MSGDLLGSRISLISRKDIRWEGVLVQVDRENASVTLQNVKSWGTEGRVEGEQIPASNNLHDCVNFRGEDIKDLHVHETAEPAVPVAAAPPAPAVTPPITPSTAATATATATATTAAAAAASVAPDAAAGGQAAAAAAAVAARPPAAPLTGGPEEEAAEDDTEVPMMRDQGRKPGRYQPPHRNPNWKPPPTVNRGPPGPASGAGSGTGALPGQGNHLLNRRTRGAGGGLSMDEQGEFDFQAGLAKFDKEKEMAILAGGISAVSFQPPSEENGTAVNGAGAGEGVTEGGEASGASPGGGRVGGPSTSIESGLGEGAVGLGTGQTTGGSAGPPAVETRSGADGGDMWVEAPVVVKKYNKSSFFDEISCDALDGRSRVSRGRHGERTRNTETFGATSVALAPGSRRYGGRGGGGGGGGGYGGYSGGGRRGYNNDDRHGGGGGDYGGSRGRSYGGGGGGGGGDRHDNGGTSTWRRG